MTDLETLIRKANPDAAEDQCIEAVDKVIVAAEEMFRVMGDKLLQVRLKPESWQLYRGALAAVMIEAAAAKIPDLLEKIDDSDFR